MTGLRITRVETLHSGFLRLLKLAIATPGGSALQREVEDHGDAVAVLPYDPANRRALLARQFRAPVLHVAGIVDVLEAPAGMLDEDDPEACARREAMEELGLRLGRLERVGTFFSSPGVSTERHHLYLAAFSDTDRVSEGGGLAEESEEIAVVPVALAELAASADAGELIDLKTFALVQALRLRQPDLFPPRT